MLHLSNSPLKFMLPTEGEGVRVARIYQIENCKKVIFSYDLQSHGNQDWLVTQLLKATCALKAQAFHMIFTHKDQRERAQMPLYCTLS